MKRIVYCVGIVGLLSTAPAFAQHDGQRDAVIQIGRGKYSEAAKKLRNKKPDSGVAETLFVEMLSELAKDRPAEALRSAKAAVAAGLRFERLLVGPREQLEKLHKRKAFQQWRQLVKIGPLIHGPMLGRVTHHSAAIWVRTERAANVSAIVTAAAGGSAGGVSVTPVSTSSDSDFTGIVQVAGLKPSTSYQYVVTVGGLRLRTGAFRTSPQPGSAGRFSVVFGGGAGYIPKWEYMWDTIRSFQPDVFLTLGDNVYIDDPKSLMTQQYCYYRRQSRPEWRRLVANVPVYSIYDDHDFGTNDCIPGPQIENPAWKRQVWNVFKQNWINPSYGGGNPQPGCWYDFRIADVHFIMLDGRYYRDLKGGSMLGKVQLDWLLRTLEASDATFKVIASPVPFTAKIKRGSRDPWDGFPEERESIFKFIESRRIDGVFLVAADRHRTDLRTTKRQNGYTLYEFESSRLTNRHTHPVVKTDGLIWGYNKTCSFGRMRFDTTAAVPQVTFEAIDIDGKVHHTFTLKRSELVHK